MVSTITVFIKTMDADLLVIGITGSRKEQLSIYFYGCSKTVLLNTITGR
tara:strand:- start:1324 stop:1470 length:147 start_codon:yes stop_codon:yes gene_type:complete